MSAGVAVVGMHRSGTSVVTRLISLLGLPPCPAWDFVPLHEGNARGDWESESLVAFDDWLLTEAGGRWWCPPRPADLRRVLVVPERSADAARSFAAVHGERWVWKDPRNCLTLPLWRRAVPSLRAAVFVTRDPAAVAESLRRRNRFSVELGLALWERYTRQALRHLAGLPVAALRYEDALADPVACADRLVHDLGGAGVDGLAAPPARVLRTLVGLGRFSPPPPAPLTGAQRRLADLAASTPPWSARFGSVPLGAESPGTAALFEQLRAEYGLAPARPPVRRRVIFDRRPASSKPAARGAVVVASTPDEPATAAQLRAIRRSPGLPKDIEVVVLDGGGGAPPVPGTRAIAVEGGRAALFAAAAEQLRVPVLVLVRGGARPCGNWWPSLLAAVEERGTAAAGVPARPRRTPHMGYEPTLDRECEMRWERSPDAPLIADTALLAGHLLAVRREAFRAADGFDPRLAVADDLDLSLRLARMGYRCRVVRDAGVVVDFARRGRNDLADLLRFASVHLEPDRLATVVSSHASDHDFATAFARVAASDVAVRRAEVDALSWHPARAIGEHFDLAGLR